MASSTTSITSRCHCASYTFTHTLPTTSLPLHGHFCHCSRCRYGTGSLSSLNAPLPTALPSGTRSKLSKFQFSDSLEIYFCEKCGSWIYWYAPDMEKAWLPIGSLELTESGEAKGGDAWEGVVVLDYHHWIESTGDGGMSDWVQKWWGTPLDRWSGTVGWKDAGKSAPCPLNWGSEARQKAEKLLTGEDLEKRLRVHCLCEGVDFSVLRPTRQDVDIEPSPFWLDPITKKRYRAQTCVCDDCRLSCGNEMMQWMSAPKHNMLLPSGEAVPKNLIFGTMKTWRSSGKATRYFCGTCAASVMWVADERADVPAVAIACAAPKSGKARVEEWLYWVDHIEGQQDSKSRGLLLDELKEGIAAWKDNVGSSFNVQ